MKSKKHNKDFKHRDVEKFRKGFDFKTKILFLRTLFNPSFKNVPAKTWLST